MKKLIFASILMILVSLAPCIAQTELNTKQVDTLGLYVRPSKSKLTAFGTKNYATKYDTLQKAIGNFKAAAPLTRIFMPTHNRSSFGTTTLVSGTKTITTPIVTANSKILVYLLSPSGTIGNNYYVSTITEGTSFVIKAVQSNATDQTGDNSTVGYIIIN